MEKKNFTPWGVSFASLALVAGMAGYLGFTNKDSLSKSNPSILSTQNSNQQTPSQNTFGSSANDDNQSINDSGGSISSGNDQSTDDHQSSFDNGSSGQENNQFSDGGFGHHRGFDTTTGGT